MLSRLTDPPTITAMFACLCAILCGCGNDSEQGDPSAVPVRSFSEEISISIQGGLYSVEFHGVRFEVPNGGDQTRSLARNGVLDFKWGGLSGTFKDGVFIVEDEMYGLMNRGDLVKLSEDGGVAVNGQQRQPLSLSTITSNGVRFTCYGFFSDFHHSSKDGTFVIEGKSYGKVKRGDEVMREADGTILVNGEVRRPE